MKKITTSRWALAAALTAWAMVACGEPAGAEDAGDGAGEVDASKDQDAMEDALADVADSDGVVVGDGDAAGDIGDADVGGDVGEGDVVPDVPTTCPPEEPPFDGACAVWGECTYGTECCCGSCDDSLVCDCNGGTWSCFHTDHCLLAACSEGCDFGQFTTPEGCKGCQDLVVGARHAIAEAASQLAACEQDAECVVVTALGGACGDLCSHAIADAQLVAFEGQIKALVGAWCGAVEPSWYCEEPWGVEACPVADTARCVDGVCQALAPCTGPGWTQGGACDDGDPCTVETVCVAAGVCEGVALDCDDGDPCTKDACDAAVGCVHTAQVASCAPSECEVGGLCQQGQCVGQGVSSWERVVGTTSKYVPAFGLALSGGDLLLGGAQIGELPSQGQVRLVRWTPAGEVVWDVTWSPPGGESAWLSGMVLGADGEIVTLVRTSSVLDTAWLVTFGADGQAGAPVVLSLPHYTVLGLAAGPEGDLLIGTATKQDVTVRRVTAAGDPVWETTMDNLDPTAVVFGGGPAGAVVAAWVPKPGGAKLEVRALTADGALAWPEAAVLGDATGTPTFARPGPNGGWIVGAQWALAAVGADGQVAWSQASGDPVDAALTAEGDVLVARSGPGNVAVAFQRLSPAGVSAGGHEWTGMALPRAATAVVALDGGLALFGRTAATPPTLWMMRVADLCEDPPCALPGCP